MAYCSWCGKGYDLRDTDNLKHYNIGDEWFCADESACRERRAAISAELGAYPHPYLPRSEQP